MNWYLISKENDCEKERKFLPSLIALPFTAFHVRKPSLTSEQLDTWMKQWSPEIHSKMVVHYDLEVASKYPVLGYHMSRPQRKSRRFVKQVNQMFTIHKWQHLSVGFHHLESLQEFEGELTHAWISPIYQSISKTMYGKTWSPFTWDKLKTIKRFKPVALGGISKDKISDLTIKGFEHAAINGAIWKSEDPLETASQLFNTSQ